MQNLIFFEREFELEKKAPEEKIEFFTTPVIKNKFKAALYELSRQWLGWQFNAGFK